MEVSGVGVVCLCMCRGQWSRCGVPVHVWRSVEWGHLYGGGFHSMQISIISVRLLKTLDNFRKEQVHKSRVGHH